MATSWLGDPSRSARRSIYPWAPVPACYRHPRRETGVACSNCGRPICPDCMTTTPVGMRCPECSRQRTPVKTLRTTARQPEVTLALIAINVAVFIAEGNLALTGGAKTPSEAPIVSARI